MVLVLDEASLVPCAANTPALRVKRLAETLTALDRLGAPRVLRSVRDAADRDLGGGRGLRAWCFDRGTDRDAGRLVAGRLGAQPYVDGPGGLLELAEIGRAIEATVAGIPVFGAGLVALGDGALVLAQSAAWPPSRPVTVRLDVLSESEEWTEHVEVAALDSEEAVKAERQALIEQFERSVDSGAVLCQRIGEFCPRVQLGGRAVELLSPLTGTEAFFPQILRHLRALNTAAEAWAVGSPFEPAGVTFSVESKATLGHGTYGPMRDFPTPDGFPQDRWTLHTKLTGGPGARLYYKPQEFKVRGPDGVEHPELRVAVGYVGPHLATVKFN